MVFQIQSSHYAKSGVKNPESHTLHSEPLCPWEVNGSTRRRNAMELWWFGDVAAHPLALAHPEVCLPSLGAGDPGRAALSGLGEKPCCCFCLGSCRKPLPEPTCHSREGHATWEGLVELLGGRGRGGLEGGRGQSRPHSAWHHPRPSVRRESEDISRQFQPQPLKSPRCHRAQVSPPAVPCPIPDPKPVRIIKGLLFHTTRAGVVTGIRMS